MVLAELAVALELLVEAAERRALVARDHRAGVKPAGAVGAMLVEREAHDRLDAGEEHPAVAEEVLVLEADLVPDGPAAARGTAPPPVRMAPDPAWGSVSGPLRSYQGPPSFGKATLPNMVNLRQVPDGCRTPKARVWSMGMTIATPPPASAIPALHEDDHEQVVIRQDPETGLRFIVAVHSTALGPSLGRDAAAPLPGRDARGARGRARPLAHDDPQGGRRRARPRRRQVGDARRRPHRAARGAPGRGRAA